MPVNSIHKDKHWLIDAQCAFILNLQSTEWTENQDAA